jgi:osmotically-inducible protein OsmY
MQTIAHITDNDLKNDVLSELRYEPSVNIADVGVLVKDGIVTLNGYASSYSEKWNAIRAVKRVAGVKAIADDIMIQLGHSLIRNDSDIAAAALNQLAWSTNIPAGALQITVTGGWITLAGEVEWWYLKNSAEAAVRHLRGVQGVTNLIDIKPHVMATGIEEEIAQAFKRSALLDAKEIEVDVSRNHVTLRGQVRNHMERDEAGRAAWAASGVVTVDNQLKVEWSLFGE